MGVPESKKESGTRSLSLSPEFELGDELVCLCAASRLVKSLNLLR